MRLRTNFPNLPFTGSSFRNAFKNAFRALGALGVMNFFERSSSKSGLATPWGLWASPPQKRHPGGRALREVTWVVALLVLNMVFNFLGTTPATRCPVATWWTSGSDRSKWVLSPRLLRSQDLSGQEVANFKMQMLVKMLYSGSPPR